MKEIAVSSDVMDTLAEWFPDCGRVIDVDDCSDALYGHGIPSGKVFDLIEGLKKKGIVEFMPFCEYVLRGQ